MKTVTCFLMAAIVFMFAQINSYGQNTEKETRDVSGFNEIGFSIAGNLYVKIGTGYQVILEGDKKFLSEIKTIVRDNKLLIRKEYFKIFENERVNVYVTLPEIKSLGVSGSGNARIEGTVKSNELNLNVSGSGKIYVSEIFAEELDCGISGSGDIILEGNGEVNRADISISGSGNYIGENLKIKNLHVGVSGSGNSTCYVIDSITASVSGSGSIRYDGNPKIDARVSGSGHVRSK